MSLHITIIGSSDRKLDGLVRSSGLRPAVATAVDLQALTRAGAVQPDILILDVRGYSQVPPALAALKRQHPTTSVLLVAQELTPALMLDAMRAGVNECVADPLVSDTIGAAISRIVAQRSSPVGGEMYAFVGAKGGVGTTTLAVNVATALARAQESTLFIDMHPSYGDAAVLLGVEPRFSLVDALENTHRLDLAFFNGLTTQSRAGVTLLASSDNPPTVPIDMHRIRLLLDFAVRNYRHTVLDVPRSNPAMLDALEAATRLFVVTNQELASVRGATRVAAALGRRYSGDKVALLVSRFDKDTAIGTDDIEDVAQLPVRCTFPSDYRLALRALNEGRPFVLEGNSKLRNAVLAFTKELNGVTLTEPAPVQPGPRRVRFGVLRSMTS